MAGWTQFDSHYRKQCEGMEVLDPPETRSRPQPRLHATHIANGLGPQRQVNRYIELMFQQHTPLMHPPLNCIFNNKNPWLHPCQGLATALLRRKPTKSNYMLQ